MPLDAEPRTLKGVGLDSGPVKLTHYPEPDAERVAAAMARWEAPHVAAVPSACQAIGYGRVMQIASEAWQRMDPVGALTVGPCAGGKR